jgi:hypothetical protein
VEPRRERSDSAAPESIHPSSADPADDLALDDFDGDFDEIVITPGRRGDNARVGADDQPPAGPHESTMIDGRARHKAVFQDQLARGLDALQNARYAEAVKYLSVAHAMDPADTHAREKLREAREKQSRPPDSA